MTAGAAFDEGLSIPAIAHTPVAAARALALGPAATALLVTAARYPFRELVYLGEDAPAFLRKGLRSAARVHIAAAARDLPADWKADVIAITVPGLPDASLALARQYSHPGTVVVVAVDKFAAGGVAKRAVSKLWRTVIPYRDFIPEAQLYLLASDSPVTTKRPVPGWSARISESYMPAMFRFPKDEYTALHALPPVSPLARPGSKP